jgi:bla regulator protein BlaR1
VNPAYLSPLANHLWQSSLFAGIAGLLTLLLRNNTARLRHWVWLAASWKFLVPFSVLISLGGQMHWRTAPQTMQSSLSVLIDGVSQPFTVPTASPAPMPAAQPAASPVPAVLWTVWASGFLGISCSWWVRWRRIRAAIRAGSPVYLGMPITAVSCPTLLEPGVFGVFRPVMLLPEGILSRLTAAQLKGVIAHELCHVSRRDNLIAAIHMFVETVFWFHPLVWWIGKRMVEERERACDEEVLRAGSEPRVYAEGILNVCKLYVESPLICVSGVAGSNLRKRIVAIMSNHVGARVSPAKKVAIAVAGMLAVAVPVAVGIMNAPPMRAQSSPSAAARPKFEVASIKACPDGDVSGGRGPKGGRAGASAHSSPVTFNLPCSTVRFYLQLAYIVSDAMLHDGSSAVRLEGGPGWIDSARYQIAAKPGGPASKVMMNGPMLQSLLEERFHLKFHRETRDMPAYALTVSAKGLKLRPADGSSCAPRDPDPSVPPGEKPWCGLPRSQRSAQRVTMDLPGATMAQLARGLWMPGDYQVIDHTGLQEKFDFHLEYATDEVDPSDDALPSVFSEVGRLGLKLEKVKAPREFMVIDHIERPSEN